MNNNNVLIEFLKKYNYRISGSNKWLYYNDNNNKWEIRTHEYKKRKITLLFSSNNIKEAVIYLEKEEIE